jgi:hypothetical protein
MKRACFSAFLAVMMVAGSLAWCQTTAMEGCSSAVQDRERQLLQGLTSEQLQLISQNTALFEQLPDPGTDPQGALQGLLSAPGIRGLRRDEAAFAILAMAGRHLDQDLREVTGGINAMNASRLLLLEAIGKLESPIAAAAADRQGRQTGAGETARTTAGAGAPPGTIAVTGPASGSARTAFYKIEYWHPAPLALKDTRGMSRQERMAEAALLKIRLGEFDLALAAMTEQVERARLRRLQLIQSLEGMARKMPNKLEKE